jgi:hypothetical protein
VTGSSGTMLPPGSNSAPSPPDGRVSLDGPNLFRALQTGNGPRWWHLPRKDCLVVEAAGSIKDGIKGFQQRHRHLTDNSKTNIRGCNFILTSILPDLVKKYAKHDINLR